MKKRVFCGSAALLMTGLTVSIFTTAEPRLDRELATQVVAREGKADVTAIEDARVLIGAIEVWGSRHAS